MKLTAYDHSLIKRISKNLADRATPHQIWLVWLFVKNLTKEKAPADAATSAEANPNPKN